MNIVWVLGPHQAKRTLRNIQLTVIPLGKVVVWFKLLLRLTQSGFRLLQRGTGAEKSPHPTGTAACRLLWQLLYDEISNSSNETKWGGSLILLRQRSSPCWFTQSGRILHPYPCSTYPIAASPALSTAIAAHCTTQIIALATTDKYVYYSRQTPVVRCELKDSSR